MREKDEIWLSFSLWNVYCFLILQDYRRIQGLAQTLSERLRCDFKMGSGMVENFISLISLKDGYSFCILWF